MIRRMIGHDRAPFVPFPSRKNWHWPNGARLAVWVVINVEAFEFDSTAGVGISNPAHEPPDVPNYSWREYGSRVGIWRQLEMFDRLGIRGSVTLNASVCDAYPNIVRGLLHREWEIMGHNWTNSRGINGMTEAEEREVIDRTLKRITKDTGHRLRPRGWLGTGLSESSRTLDILAEHGIEYVGDWVNDEQPYELRTATNPIVAMPYSLEINDIGIFLRRGYTGPDYAEMLRDQFDVLYAESAKTSKVMCIALHPFITGVPFRAKHLEDALQHMRRHDQAWFATGIEILNAWRQATGNGT